MSRELTDAKLAAEIARCEYCERKPCKTACPANCSPTDFIMAAKMASLGDYQRAAGEILSHNPLGGVCGMVCPKRHCMAGCVHKDFDYAINIPAIQATIINKANENNCLPTFNPATTNGHQIAIIGAGPAGLGAAALLSQQGFVVEIFEQDSKAGGACNKIPDKVLPKKYLHNDVAFIEQLGHIKINYQVNVTNPEKYLQNFAAVIVCTGKDSNLNTNSIPKIFYAGDLINGSTSVVEAVASGKNAANKVIALLDSRLRGNDEKRGNNEECRNDSEKRSAAQLAGLITRPVDLACDFFGQKIISPFLLSASPNTDGYEQMQKAYRAGWAGGVMKTAFDGLPIHIPSEYMFVYNNNTYANCDNVSCHPLDRVCEEIAKLIKEFPDRLTIGGTGGTVTGDDEADKSSWQNNTRKLEQAGAKAVEYSLSCPQGGEGTAGAIVSQNAELSAKIVDWVMAIGDPNIPKLFKLTGAVTSIIPIVTAIKKVFAKYPNKKAGITLANSFPTLEFRTIKHNKWPQGIVAGMSGDGVKHISFLTLANAANLGVEISGNGGPMDYQAAANFLALGVNTVQFCTIVMKYGLNIINELCAGLSFLLKNYKFKSVAELRGCALPNPIIDFMDLPSSKKVAAVNPQLCEHCGNCARCPYLAISYDENIIPIIDSQKCVGCSLCVQKCFAGALYMCSRKQ